VNARGAAAPASGRESRDRSKEFLVVAATAMLVSLILWSRTAKLLPGTALFAAPADHHKYIRMAQDGVMSLHIAPYSWRVLTPLIVHFLPGTLIVRFQLVAFLSLWTSAILVYYICRRSAFDRTLSMAGLLLFCSLGYAVKFNMFDFWLSDPLAFVFVLTSILLLLDDRILLFAFTLAIGVLAKESVIFVAPLYYSFKQAKPWEGRLALKTLALALPSVVVLAILRLANPADNGYSLTGAMSQAIHGRAADFVPTLVHVFSAFGLLLPILALVGGRGSVAVLRRYWPFVVGVLAQLLFALNTQRLVVLGFPVVVLMALEGLSRIRQRFGLSTFAVIASCVVFVATDLVDPARAEPGAVLQVLALLLVTLICLLDRLTHWSPPIHAADAR